MTTRDTVSPTLVTALFLAALLPLAACEDAPEDNPSRVRGLRVLAIRANPPQVVPGGTAVLEALVADPKGGGRPIEHRWSFCTALLDPLGLGTVDPTVCLEEGATIPIGAGETVAWDVPADLVPAGQTSIGAPVFLEVRAGSEHHAAVKDVHVASSAATGANPTFAPILVEGIPESDPAVVPWGGRVSLESNAPGNFASVYWYVSRGHIHEDDWSIGGNPARWVLDGDGEPDGATVWGVLESEAGTAWRSRDVAFE